MDGVSIYDFINNKYTMDDYMECFVITMGILLIVYMFVISRSEPTMVLVITFALVFAFLGMVQQKYKTKYNNKLQDVRGKVDLIRKKLNIRDEDNEVIDPVNTSSEKPDKPEEPEKPEKPEEPEKQKKHKNIHKCFKCNDSRYVYNWKKMKNEYECHDEPTCTSCGNKWCISPQYNGQCVSKSEKCDKTPPGQRPKHESYTLGGQDISNFSEYAANGGSLFKNYQTCMGCHPNSSATLDTNGNVKCIPQKGGFPKDHKIDPRYKHHRNCLNRPDDEIPGFGCPSKSGNYPNIKPIDPDKNNGEICKYAP